MLKNVDAAGEDLYDVPRVQSQHSRMIYTALWNIAAHLNPQHPALTGNRKRGHSMGSAQALIVQMALSNRQIIDELRMMMMDQGENYVHAIPYTERFYFPKKQ